MILELFFFGGKFSSDTAYLMRARDNCKIGELKFELEKHIKIPVECQQILYIGNSVNDHDEKSLRPKKSEGIVSDPSDCIKDLDADIVVFYKETLVCMVRYVKDNQCCSTRKHENLKATSNSKSKHRCPRKHDYSELFLCSFIIPKVVSYGWSRIFKLMETQNLDLDTDKWIIISQKRVDPNVDEVVFEGDVNLKVLLFVDSKSIASIEQRDRKIKYLFWNLPFHLCQKISCH